MMYDSATQYKGKTKCIYIMDPVPNRNGSIMLKTSQEQLWYSKRIKKREMSMGWRMFHGRYRTCAGQEAYYEVGGS